MMNLAKLIDHTMLKPDANRLDIERLCQEAVDHGFFAVCIPPFYVREAREILEDSPIKVATVIGFPMGYSTTPAKVEEIKRALDDGADELDVVANINAVKSGNWNYVKNDIDSVTRAVHLRGKVIKIIVETALLTDEELTEMCKICAEVGVNYVKTSSGYHGGASLEKVRKLRSLLPPSIKLKASGGIKTAAEARQFVEAGASRIGTSSGLAILNG